MPSGSHFPGATNRSALDPFTTRRSDSRTCRDDCGSAFAPDAGTTAESPWANGIRKQAQTSTMNGVRQLQFLIMRGISQKQSFLTSAAKAPVGESPRRGVKDRDGARPHGSVPRRRTILRNPAYRRAQAGTLRFQVILRHDLAPGSTRWIRNIPPFSSACRCSAAARRPRPCFPPCATPGTWLERHR